MNTTEMVEIALKLAGLDAPTIDSEIPCHGENIKRVVAGIDMGEPALLAAKMKGYDCVVEHHGIMHKCVNVGDQMYKDQFNHMVEFGVPINVAQKAIEDRAKEETLKFHSKNMDRKGQFARFLEMPYIGIHTPADMIGEKLVQARMDELNASNPKATVQDVIDALNEFPEYKNAMQDPIVRVGHPGSYAGRICVVFAGMTGGGLPVYKAYYDAGVGTLVMMHMKDEDVRALKEYNKGNLVIAGHMASDSIGMNRIIAAWEAAGLEVTKIGGLVDENTKPMEGLY